MLTCSLGQLLTVFTLAGFITRCVVGCMQGVTGNQHSLAPIQAHFCCTATSTVDDIRVVPFFKYSCYNIKNNIRAFTLDHLFEPINLFLRTAAGHNEQPRCQVIQTRLVKGFLCPRQAHFLAHAMQKVSYIVGLTALRLAFFKGFE